MQNNQGVTALFMCVLMESDLEAAVAFYTKIGCELHFHLPNQWAEFRINGVRLGLMATEVKQPDIRTGIVLEVQDLKAFYQELSAEGVEFLSEPREKPHGIMTAFKDPSGNILEVYQSNHQILHQKVEGTERPEGSCGRKQDCCRSKGAPAGSNDDTQEG